jgi:RecB family exonuclease
MQSREPEHAASATDRFFARPAEFQALPAARSGLEAWADWHRPTLTAHDGLVRAGHPLLLEALNRRQSASSLAKLLRDPLGYLWTYGFRWAAPEETEEPINLDPRDFGTLLHEILQAAVNALELARPGGFAAATREEVAQAVEAAGAAVAARWLNTRPVPPPAVWQRKLAEAQELARVALADGAEPLVAQQSWAEIRFGGDAEDPDIAAPEGRALPWDPTAPVVIPGTTIAIRGTIDRLDVAGDRRSARVTDYKSGKSSREMQLNGGAELQRCLYAYAVRALIAGAPEVEARLLYPRTGKTLLLADPVQTLDRLSGYLAAALQSFAEGNTLPGPATAEEWYDLAFALPGAARESYLAIKQPLVAAALAPVAPLWDEA